MRIWVMPLFVVGILTLFVVISMRLFLNNEKLYRSARSERIAESIADTINNEIRQRVTVMQVISMDQHYFDPERYGRISAMLKKEYADFYAINLVSPEGVIVKVFPEAPNQAALNHNLLKERPELRSYLLDSRKEKTAKMSHLVMTYQKVPAYILYIPRYDSAGNFTGWLDGVVDFQNWVKRYFEDNNLQNTHIRIRWDNPESQVTEAGPSGADEIFSYEYQIINQKIFVDVGFANSPLDIERDRYFTLLLAVGLILLLLISIFLIELTYSRERARVVNSYLSLKSSLLSSLTHDISSPLMILAINFERAKAGANLTAQQKERIEHSLKTMEDMLKNASFLHAQELGLMQIKPMPVQLARAVKESLALVTEQAAKKNIKIELVQLPEDVQVMAEASTLANNIILNAFTNAIKFSPIDGNVKVYAKVEPNEVELIFEDQGPGFSERQIRSYRQKPEAVQASAEASGGERGTGLGLLQIRSLLSFYGGRLRLQNNDMSGARVVLIFRRANPD